MENFRVIDGKKFGWDGEDYESESMAQKNFKKYLDDGFEAELIEEDEKYFIYTRRVAAEIVIDGQSE